MKTWKKSDLNSSPRCVKHQGVIVFVDISLCHPRASSLGLSVGGPGDAWARHVAPTVSQTDSRNTET